VIRLLLAFSGAVFCGSIGAFFLFVPPLWIATACLALIALPLSILVLLDCYGLHVELQPAPSDDSDRTD
jgi:choline-glycine betaine transporter